MRNLVIAIVVVIGLCVTTATILVAQTSSGAMDITVVDQSDAVIPNAKVTILGTETGNIVRDLATNAEGIAAVAFLRPSTYTIEVSVAGFEKLVRQGIVLRSGDILALRLVMQPGTQAQSVTVVGQTPLLEEKSSELSATISATAIAELPLNGRNYLEAGNFIAGAIPSHGSRDDTFSMYGNNGIDNAFLLDGARNESFDRGLGLGASGGSPVLSGRDAYRPPVDALAEFTVQSSNYSAEYGDSAGAVIMAVTKSGTNQIHGTAYEYLQNTVLNARNFFAETGAKPPLVQNQFGGSLGGPLRKNRAWLFGAYEVTTNATALPYLNVVPTASERQGNFGSINIYDPSTTVCNAGETVCSRTQFANNTIPTAEISSIGQSLINYYPLPNVSGASNYSYVSPQPFHNQNFVVRNDWQISSRISMFGRLALTRYHLDANGTMPAPATTPVPEPATSNGFGYGWTQTINPTLVNVLRLNWANRFYDRDSPLARNQIIPGMLDPQVDSYIPSVGVSGFTGLGGDPACCGNLPTIRHSNVYDVGDNLSKVFGKHLMKFGFQGVYIRTATYSALNGRGSMGFTGVFSQNPASRSGTGNAAADLLLGDANNVTTGTMAIFDEEGKYAGFYFEDDWTVTKNLTLNLGLRYELQPDYIERYNRMADFVLDPSSKYYGQMVLAGNPNFPRSVLTTDYNNLAPRVGFAYRVPGSQNLVVRGGYGIFYYQDPDWGVTSRITDNPPFYGYGTVNISSDQEFPSTGLVLSPTASVPRAAPVTPSQFVFSPTSTASINSWTDLEYAIPYIQEWNITVEKQLPWNMLWETSYVGNIGIGLYDHTYPNQPLTNGPGSVTTRRPLAQYTVAPIVGFSPYNRTHFEGLSTRLEKRMSHGLQFQSTLTYGKAMDLGNPALDVCDGCQEGVPNTYNLNSLLGASDQDIRLRYTLTGDWNLPFGPGSQWADHGVQKALLRDWQVNGIYQVQTGYPFTPVLSFDNANAGNTNFPNRTCNGQLSNATIQEWFNTGCFAAAPQYQFGNSGRNILYGPGIDNLDFALRRSFPVPLREQMRLDFRVDAFNLFNHPQFGQPGATVSTSTFGVISGTSVGNRTMQFMLRLEF